MKGKKEMDEGNLMEKDKLKERWVVDRGRKGEDGKGKWVGEEN